MSASLDGPRAKIERAKEHSRNLHSEVLSLENLDPYEVVVEPEPDPRERVIRIRTDYSPPLRWGAIAGDAVHNLRSALDLLVYQLVIANGKRPDIRTEFPIFLDATKYKMGGPRKVKGAAKAAMDIINALQPCFKMENPERHPLWLLHSLDIRDKHQLLNVAVAAAQTQQFGLNTGGNFDIVGSEYTVYVSPIENGTELGRFRLTRPDAEVNVDTHITFHVVFEDFGLGDNLAIVPTIRGIGEFVEYAVGLFDPFFN